MSTPFRLGTALPSLADLLRDTPSFTAPTASAGLLGGLLEDAGGITVSQRFERLLANLTLTREQRQDGVTKANGIHRRLNAHYYDAAAGQNGCYVGSWGKATQIRPPRDIDLMYLLPNEVYWRFDKRLGNKQSQLLQEVRTVLSFTYPTTEMRGDGQVVVVPFASYSVEVVPAFRLRNGQALICDTNDGGRYKTADPIAETKAVEHSHAQTNGNTRDLIRMLKRWQEYCSVPLKSFAIELLVVEFLASWPHRGKSTVYYDWMVRDFFRFLKEKPAHSFLLVPGTSEIIRFAGDWRSRAESAYIRAEKACRLEADKMPYSAGQEWQKIFGTFIPVS